VSVAVLCNLASADAARLGHEVAGVYLESVIPKKPDAASPDTKNLEATAGL